MLETCLPQMISFRGAASTGEQSVAWDNQSINERAEVGLLPIIIISKQRDCDKAERPISYVSAFRAVTSKRRLFPLLLSESLSLGEHNTISRLDLVLLCREEWFRNAVAHIRTFRISSSLGARPVALVFIDLKFYKDCRRLSCHKGTDQRQHYILPGSRAAHS